MSINTTNNQLSLEQLWLKISSLQDLKFSNDKNLFYVMMHRSDWTEKAYLSNFDDLWLQDSNAETFLQNKYIYKLINPELYKANLFNNLNLLQN